MKDAARRRRAPADRRRRSSTTRSPLTKRGRRRLRQASTATRSAPSTPSTPRGTWTQLRQSLGDDKLTYLGYSYGTTLGSTYAELFPDKVRALVLDGAVDPDTDPKAAAEAQRQAFEAGFDAFAANCVGADRRLPGRRRPPPVRQRPARPRPTRRPIPSSEPGETRQATPGRHPDGGPGRRSTDTAPGRSWRRRWPARASGDAEGPVRPRRQLLRPARGRHVLQPRSTPTSR